ncbi:GMC oxidoreductase, partial [Acinetobacter baumannii]
SGAFLKVDPDSPCPDVQLHFVIAPLEDHGRTAVKAHGFSGHVCVLRPESTGTVRLGSIDARDTPLIDPNFLSDRRDVDLMIKG